MLFITKLLLLSLEINIPHVIKLKIEKKLKKFIIIIYLKIKIN
jgi:hypothetical protein